MKPRAKCLIGFLVVLCSAVLSNYGLKLYWNSVSYKVGRVLAWGQLPALPNSSRISLVHIESSSLLFLYEKKGVLAFTAPMDDIRRWISRAEFILPGADFDQIRKEKGVLKYDLVGGSSVMEVDEKTGMVNIHVSLSKGPD